MRKHNEKEKYVLVEEAERQREFASAYKQAVNTKIVVRRRVDKHQSTERSEEYLSRNVVMEINIITAKNMKKVY